MNLHDAWALGLIMFGSVIGCVDKPVTEQVESAMATDENSHEAAKEVYDRGLDHAHQGELDQAVTDFTEAIRLDAEYTSAYNSRGTASSHKGEYGRAIADFTEAIRIDPEFARAYFNRGLTHEKKGDQGKAEADFAKAKELGYKPK